MEKILIDPSEMDHLGIEDCASAFRSGNYEIITTLPSRENVPHELSKTLQEKANYKIILDDQEAEYSYFSVVYETSSGERISIPIGAYGISNKKKATFPLVINGTWIKLLKLDKNTFCVGLGINKDCDLYFSRFLSWKKEFINKIFTYYLNSSTYCSAMSWKIKGEKSNTRMIAEACGFHRVSFNNNELYSKYKLEENSDLLKYFKNCLFRWDIVGRDELQFSTEIHTNVVTLVSSIVTLSQDTQIPY